MEQSKTNPGAASVVAFVLLYIVLMLPTYFLPYLGSNSAVWQGSAAAANEAILHWPLWIHLFCLLALMLVAWIRGKSIGKRWLVIFPILAALFDMIPGINLIPLVPTVMHLLAIILGVVGASQTAIVSTESGP